jgi:hypothetical protein
LAIKGGKDFQYIDDPKLVKNFTNPYHCHHCLNCGLPNFVELKKRGGRSLDNRMMGEIKHWLKNENNPWCIAAVIILFLNLIVGITGIITSLIA